MSATTPLDLVTDLTAFLTGQPVAGIALTDSTLQPRLTQAQADTVVWYLANLYTSIPDHILRCDQCGQLYDSHQEGRFFDHGRPPHSFCHSCLDSAPAITKAREARRLEKSLKR